VVIVVRISLDIFFLLVATSMPRASTPLHGALGRVPTWIESDHVDDVAMADAHFLHHLEDDLVCPVLLRPRGHRDDHEVDVRASLGHDICSIMNCTQCRRRAGGWEFKYFHEFWYGRYHESARPGAWRLPMFSHTFAPLSGLDASYNQLSPEGRRAKHFIIFTGSRPLMVIKDWTTDGQFINDMYATFAGVHTSNVVNNIRHSLITNFREESRIFARSGFDNLEDEQMITDDSELDSFP
jgi:hypothetical protein